MDLRSSLEEIAGPAMPPTPDQLAADIARGRKALRRRRTAQAAGGGVFAVAAVVAALSVTASSAPSTGPTVAQPAAPSAAASAAASIAPKTRLVAYLGKQPQAFTVDKVPDGWFIQSETTSSLVVAPRNPRPQSTQMADGPGPDVTPSVNPIKDPESFVGKIVVMLQSTDQDGVPDGTKVTIAGRDAVLVKGPDNTTGRTLWVSQPNGIWMLVQFWDDIGLTQDQMVDFGAGVHVHKGAVQGHG